MTARDLTGRVALVTGSTRGIGWASAQLLAENGATVVVHGRDADAVASRVAELQERFPGQHSGAPADVAQADEVRGVIRQVFGTHRRLDVLVNNAGILDDALIGMVTDEALERTFAINAMAPVHFLQGAARLMQRSGAGSIINVSSIIGVNGNAGQIAYASSKAAVIGLTKAAAKELAPSGIRVNAIAPGFIDSEMARSVPADIFQQRLDSIGMQRIGTPADVANTVLFLASDLSEYVTGQVIGVDGGMKI